jgi:ribonuclease P protein component
MKRSLTRFERLKRRSDIEAVFLPAPGCPLLGAKLFWVKNGFPYNRIVCTLAKRYGNAVERNRAKRFIREIYRTEKYSLKGGHDMIVLMYPGAYDFWKRKEQFEDLCSKAGLFFDTVEGR